MKAKFRPSFANEPPFVLQYDRFVDWLFVGGLLNTLLELVVSLVEKEKLLLLPSSFSFSSTTLE